MRARAIGGVRQELTRRVFHRPIEEMRIAASHDPTLPVTNRECHLGGQSIVQSPAQRIEDVREWPLICQRFMNGQNGRVPLTLTPRLGHARAEQRPQHQKHGGTHELVQGNRAETDRFHANE